MGNFAHVLTILNTRADEQHEQGHKTNKAPEKVLYTYRGWRDS
jgi:hypothetical protein